MEQSPSCEANSTLTQSRNYLAFMKPEGSLLCSQEPTGPYPEPDESNPHAPTQIL
jgi:hypothetical protein